MSIERHKPARLPFVKDLIASQLMIDPGEHGPKFLGRDQTKHIPDSIGSGLVRTHQAIHRLGTRSSNSIALRLPRCIANIAKALIQIAEVGILGL